VDCLFNTLGCKGIFTIKYDFNNPASVVSHNNKLTKPLLVAEQMSFLTTPLPPPPPAQPCPTRRGKRTVSDPVNCWGWCCGVGWTDIWSTKPLLDGHQSKSNHRV